jgi:hypothetical protein
MRLPPPSIVVVIVGLPVMARVVVAVGAMLPGMFVVVVRPARAVAVGMGVFVPVFVGVGMFVGMGVRFVPVGVGVRVLVQMAVVMLVPVLVVAFHGVSSWVVLPNKIMRRRQGTTARPGGGNRSP